MYTGTVSWLMLKAMNHLDRVDKKYFPDRITFSQLPYVPANTSPAVEKTVVPMLIGPDNEPIPPAFEELPSQEVFTSMFVRRMGNDLLPLTISGKSMLFDSTELYRLLKDIRHSKNTNVHHLSVYGTVMALIMRAHGEEPNTSALN